jgi:chromosome segregation ATPase
MNKSFILLMLLLLLLVILPTTNGGIISIIKKLFKKNKYSSSCSSSNSNDNYNYNELLNEIKELKEYNYMLSCQVTSLKNRVTLLKKDNDILRLNFIKLKEKHNNDIKEITDSIVKKLEDDNNNKMNSIRQKYEQELSSQRKEVDSIKKEFADKVNSNAIKAKAEIKKLIHSKEQAENELAKVKEQLSSPKRRVSINRVRLSKEETRDDDDEDEDDNGDSDERPRSWSYTSKPPSKKFIVKRGRGIRR